MDEERLKATKALASKKLAALRLKEKQRQKTAEQKKAKDEAKLAAQFVDTDIEGGLAGIGDAYSGASVTEHEPVLVQTTFQGGTTEHELEKLRRELQLRDGRVRDLEEQLNTAVSLQREYQEEAGSLSAQVHHLQEQLRQSADVLKSRGGEHGASVQALREAKKEILSLQTLTKEKAEQIVTLQKALEARDQAMSDMNERFADSARNFAKLRQCFVTLETENSALKRERNSNAMSMLQYEHHRLQQEHQTMKEEQQSVKAQAEQAQQRVQSLEQENKQLRRRAEEMMEKEHGSSRVLRELMEDVERMHREGPMQEHDSRVDEKLARVRFEVEEMFGQQLAQIKEQHEERYKVDIEKLTRQLEQEAQHKNKLQQEVGKWQKMYFTLSQTGATGVDSLLQRQTLEAEITTYKEKVNQLTLQVHSLEQEIHRLRTVSGDVSVVAGDVAVNGVSVQEAGESSEGDEREAVMDGLRRQLKEAKDLAESLSRELVEVTKSKADIEQSLKVALEEKQELVHLKDKMRVDLNQIRETMEKEGEQVRVEKEGIVAQLDAAQASLREMEMERSGYQEMVKVKEQLEVELGAMKTEHVQLKDSLKAQEEHIQKLKGEHEVELKAIHDQFEVRLNLEVEEWKVKVSQSSQQVQTVYSQWQTYHQQQVQALQEQLAQARQTAEITAKNDDVDSSKPENEDAASDVALSEQEGSQEACDSSTEEDPPVSSWPSDMAEDGSPLGDQLNVALRSVHNKLESYRRKLVARQQECDSHPPPRERKPSGKSDELLDLPHSAVETSGSKVVIHSSFCTVLNNTLVEVEALLETVYSERLEPRSPDALKGHIWPHSPRDDGEAGQRELQEVMAQLKEKDQMIKELQAELAQAEGMIEGHKFWDWDQPADSGTLEKATQTQPEDEVTADINKAEPSVEACTSSETAEAEIQPATQVTETGSTTVVQEKYTNTEGDIQLVPQTVNLQGEQPPSEKPPGEQPPSEQPQGEEPPSELSHGTSQGNSEQPLDDHTHTAVKSLQGKIAVLHEEILSLQGQLEASREESHARKSELSEALTRLEERELKVENLQVTVKSFEEALSKNEAEFSEHKERTESQKDELDIVVKARDNLAAEVERLQRAAGSRKEGVEDLQREVEASQGSVTRLMQEIQLVQQENEELKKKCELTADQRKSAEERLGRTTEELVLIRGNTDRLAEQLAVLEARLIEVQAERDALRAEARQAVEDTRNLDASVENLEAENRNLMRQVDDYKAAVAERDSVVAGLQHRLHEMSVSINNDEVQRSSEMQELQVQITSLKTLCQEQTTERDSLSMEVCSLKDKLRTTCDNYELQVSKLQEELGQSVMGLETQLSEYKLYSEKMESLRNEHEAKLSEQESSVNTLEKRVELLNRDLELEKMQASATMSELESLSTLLAEKEELVASLDSKVQACKSLEGELRRVQEELESKERELSEQKAEIAEVQQHVQEVSASEIKTLQARMEKALEEEKEMVQYLQDQLSYKVGLEDKLAELKEENSSLKQLVEQMNEGRSEHGHEVGAVETELGTVETALGTEEEQQPDKAILPQPDIVAQASNDALEATQELQENLAETQEAPALDASQQAAASINEAAFRLSQAESSLLTEWSHYDEKVRTTSAHLQDMAVTLHNVVENSQVEDNASEATARSLHLKITEGWAMLKALKDPQSREETQVDVENMPTVEAIEFMGRELELFKRQVKVVSEEFNFFLRPGSSRMPASGEKSQLQLVMEERDALKDSFEEELQVWEQQLQQREDIIHDLSIENERLKQQLQQLQDGSDGSLRQRMVPGNLAMQAVSRQAQDDDDTDEEEDISDVKKWYKWW